MPAPEAEDRGSEGALLRRIADEHGTPAYVSFLPRIRERAAALRRAFPGLELSYAVKANPNPALLARLAELVEGLDVSSGGELRAALAAGWAPGRLRFTGPAKRPDELELAVEAGIGAVVLESVAEARELAPLAEAAGGRDVLVRIAPRRIARGFGVRLAGKPTRFGIDEEELDGALEEIRALPGLALAGFHAYSGSQCLRTDSLVETFRTHAELFAGAARRHGIEARVLVFGAGFGIPYAEGDEPLPLDELGRGAAPVLEELAQSCGNARLVLELGRYLVGEAGLYLTRVLRTKRSRGTEIAICDGGMHHNLAACGHLGGALGRGYPLFAAGVEPGARAEREVDVVGPLCTSIDTLARGVSLPALEPGDVLAVRSSGAYGATASPLLFLGHPPPRELLVDERDGRVDVLDVTSLRPGDAGDSNESGGPGGRAR